MYTFYSYWNAEQVRDVLNIIAMIMNGNDYLGLLKAIAIAGLLVAAGGAIVRMRGEEPLGYFIVLGMFYGILFVPRVTVTVQDMRTPTIYTVANVPLGVGFFASEASHIGKWLTETFETTFSPINDELQYSNTGMVFGAHLMSEMQQVEPMSATLKMDLLTFIKDCVNPELLDNPALMDEMTTQEDLWGWIGGSGNFSLNPGRMTNISDGTGTNSVFMCTDNTNTGAYTVLGNRLTADATDVSLRLGGKLMPGRANLQATIEAAIVGVEGVMMNASRTAAESIRQGVMMNMLTKGQTTISAMMNDPSSVQVAMADNLAGRQKQIQDGLMIETAQKAMPRIRNAIELVVIAVFPIVFLLIVAAGIKAGMVFKTYLMTVFWVNLWAPIYAVINYLQTSKDATDMLAATAGGTNTIQNFASLADVAASSQHITGMLTLSVPFIAYALVRGGEVAMNSVMSNMSATTTSSAGSGASPSASGNQNVGNYSWGNTSAGNFSGGNWSSGNSSWGNTGANKDDRSSSWTDPSMTNRTGPSGSYQTNGAGQITGMQANSWNVGGTAGGGTDQARSDAAVSSQGVRATQGRSASLDLSTGATSSDRATAQSTRAIMTAISSRLGSNSTSGLSSQAGKGSTTSNEVSTSSNLQNAETANFNTGANFGGSVNVNQPYSAAPGKPGVAPGAAQGAAPVGGAAPGAQAANGGQSASSTTNPGNLPVPYGAGGRDTGNPDRLMKSGPKTGNAGSNVGADMGMNFANAQSVIDTAINKSGAVDQKSQQQAANMVRSAVSEVMSNTNDAKTRSAVQDFASGFESAVRSGMQSNAGVQREQSAGNQRQEGTSNRVGGSYSSGFQVAQELLKMAGGDPMKALEMASQNPQAVAQATLAAAASMQSSSAGGETLSAGGARAPQSQGSVESAGNKAVDNLGAKGKSAVQAANQSNRAAVASQQVANPSSAPDTSGATSAYSSTAASVDAAYQQFSGDTSVDKGAQAVANALYNDDQKGVGTVMSNALLGGAGYQSGAQYKDAVMAAAANSPRLADTLRQIDQSGGQVTPQAKEFIQSELKAQEDAKPGFFASFLK